MKEIYGFGRKFWVCREFRFGRNGFAVMLFAAGVGVNVLVLVVRGGCEVLFDFVDLCLIFGF